MARPKKQPDQKNVRQNISISPKLLARVIAYCQEEDRPISWVVCKGLEMFFDKNVA